ncbi:hypothetical protein [Sphingobacterium bambusae]|uniref:N-acetyltransferase n=1 Tax=Sphingobacterium bambusae TaxID=662858 RepID=A0ABW6BJN3_9SPHI|nr:hypothetical protein [Sphingobacterium bambusae]WPL49420.1 hypothetical protein SCB77_03000 [Sphingobacterium bambusae]
MENYSIKILEKNELLKLAQFVVNQNANHHSEFIRELEREARIAKLLLEEVRFSPNSRHYVAENSTNQEIVGCIRLLKWDNAQKLPLQQDFAVDVDEILKDRLYVDVWHIGRFAIAHGIRSIGVFKALMLSVIGPISSGDESLTFAECDEKLLKVLNLLEIRTTIVGKPKFYLGSRTYPISISKKTLKDFFQKNMDSIGPNICEWY